MLLLFVNAVSAKFCIFRLHSVVSQDSLSETALVTVQTSSATRDLFILLLIQQNKFY